MTSGHQQDGHMEDALHWMAQTGEMGLESPDRKYVSRLRFEGVGDTKLYSITKTVMKGSDRR